MITFKFLVFLCVFFTLLCLVSAVYIVKGNGDWMLNNYNRLSPEKKARINIVRLRWLTAALLVYLAVVEPFMIYYRHTSGASVALEVITALVVLAFITLRYTWVKRN